jgi:hypothetical protein
MSEHVIRIEANCGCDRIYEPWFSVICSCGKVLVDETVEPMLLQEINAVAMEHLYASYPATHELVSWHQEWRPIADVPAQGYVHGLDPAEEDPRRAFYQEPE